MVFIPALTTEGLWLSIILGSWGAAAAASKMLSWISQKTRMSFEHGRFASRGLWAQAGIHVHTLESGFASRGGVACSLLAKEGVKVRQRVLKAGGIAGLAMAV